MKAERNKLYMNINYTLKRSRKRRKTISLNISHNNEIVVHAPYFTPAREINSFVLEKQKWIDKTIKRHADKARLIQEREFVSGECFYYLGEGIELEAFFEPKEKNELVFWNKRFYLNSPDDIKIKRHLFVVWYKRKAREHISERVAFFCRQFNVRAQGVRIASARQRWGSCSPDNKLAFSFRLMMMPPEIIDYVVVHELMHIREKSHSKRFWKLVEEAMPQYKIRGRRLRELGERFIF